MKLNTSLAFLGFASVSMITQAIADSHQHGAHEHGAAQLLIAQEGNEIQITLDSPSYNLVGFEHEPSTSKQKEAYERVMEIVEDSGDTLFGFNTSAGCSVEHSLFESPWFEDHDHDEHDHDEHDHDEHDHDEHDHDEHDHDEHDHDEHDHDEHDDVHSDIVASWHFECAAAAKVTEIDTSLFVYFKNLESVNASWLTDQGQGATVLTETKTKVQF